MAQSKAEGLPKHTHTHTHTQLTSISYKRWVSVLSRVSGTYRPLAHLPQSECTSQNIGHHCCKRQATSLTERVFCAWLLGGNSRSGLTHSLLRLQQLHTARRASAPCALPTTSRGFAGRANRNIGFCTHEKRAVSVWHGDLTPTSAPFRKRTVAPLSVRASGLYLCEAMRETCYTGLLCKTLLPAY